MPGREFLMKVFHLKICTEPFQLESVYNVAAEAFGSRSRSLRGSKLGNFFAGQLIALKLMDLICTHSEWVATFLDESNFRPGSLGSGV